MIYIVAIFSVESTFSVKNLYLVHNARTYDYFISTFVTLWYLYLVLCGHVDMSSDLLLSIVDLLAGAITSVRWGHTQVTSNCTTLVSMGLLLHTPINIDVLLFNTFITQLPIVFGELSVISLAGVFEIIFVVSIATFELWFREIIILFLGMIWHSDSCIINYKLYLHAVSFPKAVFGFITVAGTGWGDRIFLRLQDLMVDDSSQVWHTTMWQFHSIYIENIYCDMDVQHGGVKKLKKNIYQY